MHPIKIECDTNENSEEKVHSFRASNLPSLKIDKPVENFIDDSHTPEFSSGEAERSPADLPITLSSFLN